MHTGMDKVDIDSEKQGMSEIGFSLETLRLDADVAKLNGMIDQWLSYLKRNILNDFIEKKNSIIQRKQQQLELQEHRHQNQIIKLQNKIRHLKNEGSLLENEMNQPEDGLDSEMNDLEVSPSIKQNDNSGLTKIPGPAAKQKKCCKNLLAQALVFERKKSRIMKLFYKWQSICKTKQINRLYEEIKEKSKVEVQGGLTQDRTETTGANLQMKSSDITLEPLLEIEVTDERSSTDNDKGNQPKSMDEIATCQTQPVNCLVEFDSNNEVVVNHASVPPSTVSLNINTHGTNMCQVSTLGTDTDDTVINDQMKIDYDTIAAQTIESRKQASCKRLLKNKERLHHSRKRSNRGRKPLTAAANPQLTDQRLLTSSTSVQCTDQKIKLFDDSSTLTIFQCNRCQMQFKQKGNLKVHQVNVHNKSSKYHCMKCDKYLPNASKFRDHMSFHNGIRNYQCKICLKRFHTKSYIQVHMRIHTGERPSVCESSRGRKPVTAEPSLQLTDQRPLMAVTSAECTNQMPQKVHVSDNSSASIIFQCDRCQMQFKQRGNLKTHQVNVHNKSSEYQCMKCDKYLPNASKFRDHMSFHDGIRNYQCEICAKRFHTKSYIKVHMRSHTGEKPFVCEICRRKFTIKGSLQKHMRIHTGDKADV